MLDHQVPAGMLERTARTDLHLRETRGDILTCTDGRPRTCEGSESPDAGIHHRMGTNEEHARYERLTPRYA